MAPAADNNTQDLATKKAKLDSNSVISGVGKCIDKDHVQIFSKNVISKKNYNSV